MRSWVVDVPGPVDGGPLRWIDKPPPQPGRGEGDLAPRRHGVVPGHEVVGVVDLVGDGCTRFGLGRRVGIPWLAGACGACRSCVGGHENLCIRPSFTGWDVDGGYAEYATVDA